jgi:nitroreductase
LNADFFTVALRQRACRNFADDDVPDADVERVLEAATHAPSGENRQPWVFVVVRDESERSQLSDLTRRLWEGGARDHASKADPGLIADVDAGVARGFGGAPVVIVVAADHRTGLHASTVGASLFPAVQNLLLAANALGYGSALTTLTTFAGDEVRAIVGLPDEIEPVAVVPIGRPAKPLGAPKRRPVSEVTYRDHWGHSW